MFFCLPFRVGQSRDDNITPLANAVLVATNILVFLFPGTVLWRNYLFFNTITYSFVHVGFWHLFCNMWVLWIFGNRLNRRLGNLWYPVVYLGTSIIIGVLLRLLLRVEVFGASGCIFAVITVCLILMPGIMIEVLCVALFPLSLLVAIFSKPNYWAYWLVRFGRFRIKAYNTPQKLDA
jgi:membrane associated rhomboid family serine protease